MVNMTVRFLKIYKYLYHALLDLGLPQFREHKIQALTEFNNTLKPLEIAINELSKNFTTLIEAEGIFQFMPMKNSLSEDLLQCLKNHIT